MRAVPEVGPGREGGLALVRAALASLEASRERIDNLNVYPVPDGDTGTNMALTVRAAVEALEATSAESREELARVVTRACLLGARGNSGVILSQLVRGAAEAYAGESPRLASVFRAASDAGYAAVRTPQEGTILTVARALADCAEELDGKDVPLPEALREILADGERALARTPEQLPVLAEAGVVDAGGAGLLELVRGVAAHLSGEPLPELVAVAEPLPLEAVHRERSRYRYCTTFFVEGDDVDPERLEPELERFGDSLLVVGSPGAAKVHVHTDEPGAVLSLATGVGVIEEVDIRNMHAQADERERRLAREPVATAAIAVCIGAGNRRIFESLGALCVEGGQSMNPAAADLVEEAGRAEAREVVLLPNNANVVSTAEQAAANAPVPAHVVPTRSLQAGLAAMVAFDAGRSGAENAAEMTEAIKNVRSGAVTRASRSATVDGVVVADGDYLGLVEDEAVASGTELADVARAVVERLLDPGADVLTVLLGEGLEALPDPIVELAGATPGLELDVHVGGQPHYPLLLSAE